MTCIKCLEDQFCFDLYCKHDKVFHPNHCMPKILSDLRSRNVGEVEVVTVYNGNALCKYHLQDELNERRNNNRDATDH